MTNNYQITENQLKWYAIHSRSRHEDVVLNGLKKKLIEAFLPKMQVMSRRTDRRKTIMVPIFPGYVFVRSDLNLYQYWDILKTHGVVRILGIQGKPVPVKDQEIASLMTLDGTDRTVRNQAYMKKGDRVMIMEGPLKGLTGFYLKHKDKVKVVISIELLQRSLAVEVDDLILDKVD